MEKQAEALSCEQKEGDREKVDGWMRTVEQTSPISDYMANQNKISWTLAKARALSRA